MAELNDTYVVHTATVTCTQGMRPSCAVLDKTHGVYLRQQPQMTVCDSSGTKNLVCFGGCYSMENPDTIAEAERIQKEVQEESPDTFLDKVMNFFTGGKKKAETHEAQEGVPRVVGKCTPNIPVGERWDNGKDGVETKGNNPLLGGAKIRCIYGGEIEIIDSGQSEGEGSIPLSTSEDGEEAGTEGAAGAGTTGEGAAGAGTTGEGAAGAGTTGESAAGAGTTGEGAVGAGTTGESAAGEGVAGTGASAAAVGEINAADAKEQLKASLKTAVDSSMNLGQQLATLPFNNSDEALEAVLSHDAAIEAASVKYNVEKEMIQAVLFQEQRLYDIGDPFGDSMVKLSHVYNQQMEVYEKADLVGQMVMGAPQPPIVYRNDTSTGLGQIRAETAIYATNWSEHTNYDPKDKKTLKLFWNNLQDEDYNIDMVGKVLDYKRGIMKEEPTAWGIMRAYNGGGKKADRYADAAIQYYKAFGEYNSTLKKLGKQK